MKYAVGFDLGGTTCKVGVFDETGKLLDKWEVQTDKKDGGKNIIPNLAENIKSYLHGKNIPISDVIGGGIGVPGAVTPDGIVNKCVNLGWDEKVAIEEQMTKYCGFPVKAGNDGDVAALGENYKGAGQGTQSMVMVTLGTGIGGGIIIENKMLIGFNGAGGEIGHIHIDDDETEQCGCGNKGCIEQYASATGIVRLAHRALLKESMDSPLRQMQHITAKDVFDQAKAGDALANQIADEVCARLGKALSIIANIINPEMFVIGGGVSKAGQIIIDKTRPSFEEYAFHACRGTKIELAKLGNDAGIYGGVGLILNK
ncbi:MAG: ROK family protein [Lachnospiraceae bacterium]|uniref:Glucokinase n=1 Tax=Candidatus Weimeria bifida TaxID=2599074 RepID=A0A6N7J1G5_9FIRM|nr:ROK family glucokinase [Candidatus Weimeria bifida]RRF96391.1 MAG: ROK family protein [Lachnospiraceae bacterium]